MKHITDLGFTKNTKRVNGFVPHFKKGNDYLFLIGSNFGCRKIVTIAAAYKYHDGNIYGVLTDKAPRAADRDWVTSKMKLIKTNPLQLEQWKADATGLEYIKTEI